MADRVYISKEESFKVAVVGGGLAGLSAAQVLSSHPEFGKANVVLLEAAPNLGGRIQSVSGLAPWPVESKLKEVPGPAFVSGAVTAERFYSGILLIGPEFLHGTQNSSMKKLVDEMGCVQRELNFPDYYYIGREGRLLSSAEAAGHADIAQVHELFKALTDTEDVSGLEDMSMAEHLRKKGVNSTVIAFAEAIYGNDFGCSLDKLGVHECIEEARQWIYGDTYIVVDRPLSSVVSYIARDLNVRVNCAVKQVGQLKDGKVRLRSQDRSVVKADHVIFSVPVTIFQQGLISFDPPLPQSKIRAAIAIGMSDVVKVVMAFSHKFWPKGLFDVVCSDCFLPEVWMTEYPQHNGNDESCYPSAGSLGQYTVVGFIAGDRATTVAQMPEVKVLRQSLRQLDRMFGKGERSSKGGRSDWNSAAPSSDAELGRTDYVHASSRVILRKDVIMSSKGATSSQIQFHPASCFFNGGMIVSWADRSFIRGGYSHPSVNARGARAELAKPVGNIFFAGEATHPGVNPCLQAAIDTGRRAAHEVIGAYRGRRSSL